jgi:two-component system CheB/CheR fusion protein
LSAPARELPLPADELDRVLAFVADERGIDFRDYRREPILRGIRQRIELRGDGSAAAYLQRLASDGQEVDRLVEAVVVPWSGFFRDPPVWTALARVVLPALLQEHPRQPLRTWCIGTATGEEAWTMAMLLEDACGARGDGFDLLASDLDRRTLEGARAGCYTPAVAAEVPPTYRARFLVAEGNRACVTPALRARVRFAYHDLLGRTLAPPEAVVASFELVLARNVLIYFDRRLQQKALERIAGTLEPGAALVLGRVETMPRPLEERFIPFADVEPDLRVFRYVGA